MKMNHYGVTLQGQVKSARYGHVAGKLDGCGQIKRGGVGVSCNSNCATLDVGPSHGNKRAGLKISARQRAAQQHEILMPLAVSLVC